MAEELKVRLVRCPKCQSLIKVPPECPVYKCGSCFAVLPAKQKEQASNVFLDKLMEEKGRRGCEKVDIELDKGVTLGSSSETAICGIEGKSRRKERIFGEKSMNISSVSSRTDKEVFVDDVKNVREHRHKHNGTEKRVGYVDNYTPSSKNYPMTDRGQRVDLDMNMNRSRSVNSYRGSKVRDYPPNLSKFARSLRLKGVPDMRGVDRDGVGGFYRRSLGVISEHDRFSALHYPDEGPSNYRYRSVYGYHKPVKSSQCVDVPNDVQNFEKDRAQLLKMLDELKDQLSSSHDTARRPRELVPTDNKMASIGHIGGSIGNKSSQYHHVSKLTDDDDVQNLYGNFHPVSKHVHSQIPYGDSLSPGMHRRPHNQVSHYHPHQRTYCYSSRQYGNEDLLAPYPNPEETSYHLPACLCLYCYENNRKGPLQAPPAGFSNRRYFKDPFTSTFNQYVNSDRVGQHYLPRAAKCSQLNFQDPTVHLWPSDIDSDVDDLGQRFPRKVVLTSRNKRLCHPVASGAPFIVCYNCLELLKLPRTFRKMMKKDQRLRCGACSAVSAFEMDKKRLIISVPGNPKRRPTESEEKTSEMLNESHPSSHGGFSTGGAIPTSCNIENFGYNQTSSKEKESPDKVIDSRDSSGPSELPFSSDVSPAVSSLPFQEQVNNPSSNRTVRGHGNGNMTRLAQEEMVNPVKNASQFVSEKNAPVATEEEVSFNGYLNTSSSHDSLKASEEENKLKLHKGSKSFLVGLIKKSFREFSRSKDNIQNERPNVLVNGHNISDCEVRKAEKQAGPGPIHPGNYWYDSRAGFWGVMGQPCSGIIPPFIEEFNYSLPENCAAGNTGIFVNGRELHQKDLDMLACKGLPNTRDKNYILEASGRVLDEGTDIQLYGLGKLAPTVEKEKRGFGMRNPGVIE